jgi:molybdenum cofactor cytidylyltransferase
MVKRFCADSSRPIVAPFFQGKRGNPVLWPRRFFNEMQQISGDQGAKELLDKYPYIVHEMEVDDSGILVDIDTPDDLDGLTIG